MEKLKLDIQLFATQLGSRGNYYVRSGSTTPSESIDNGGDYSGFYYVYYTHLTNGHTTIQVDTVMRRHTSAPPTSSTNEGTCRWGSTSVSNTINGQTKTHTISAGYYVGSARTTYYSGVYFSDTFDVDMTNGRPYTLSGSLVFGGYRIDPSYIGTVPANPYGQSRINSADNLTANYGESTGETSVLFTQYIADANHKLNIKYGSTVIKEINGYESGATFQLTNAELQAFYNLTQNVPSPYTITLELLTYSGSTQIGSASTFNIQLEVNNLEPEISNVTYTNSTSTLSGDNPIKSISNITIEADITTKSTTIANASVNGIPATIVGNHLTCEIEKVETNEFIISITDARGYTTTQTITKGTIIPYLKLSYDGNSHRLNPTSGVIVLDLRTATFWSGKFKPESEAEPNTLTIKYKLWQAGTIEPTGWTTIANAITTSSGSTTITPAENTYSMQQQTADLYGYKNAYKLKVLLQDKINSYEIERNITRGQPVYHWDDKDFFIGNSGDDAKIYLNGEIFTGGDSIPIGTITQFSGTTAPEGWLICNGDAISRTAYDKLYEVIGTTYGAGDGSTTFNIPDLRGRIAVGMNNGTFNLLGATGGEETHLLTTNEMPSHNHGENVTGSDWNVNPYVRNSGSGSTGIRRNVQSSYGGGTRITTDSVGGGQAHNNLQPYIVTNFIIKAFSKSETPTGSEVKNNYSESLTDTYSCNYINNNGGGVKPSDLLNYIYPVGSIYMSVNNVSPQEFLGGTWTTWGAGKVPVSVDTNDASFNTVEKTGGSKNYQKHNHRGRYRGGSLGTYYFLRRINSADGYDGEDQVTYDAGSGTADNLQPYITCYMWKRTA